MARILNFYNPEDFKLMYDWIVPQRILYYEGNNPIYARNLNSVVPPVVFDKRIITVDISTTTTGEGKWYYGGRLQQILRLSENNENLDRRDYFSDDIKSLWLWNPNLLIFDSVITNYQISIKLPRWFINAKIKIHQYEGVDTSDPELDIKSIKSHLGIS